MIKIEDLERRTDPTERVPAEQYATGILNIVDFLVVELEKLMRNEGRCKGIVKSYLSNIDITFQKIYVNRTIKDTIVFCKILYLFKPLLIDEFGRLTRKKLSPADTCITIIRKLLLIVSEQVNYSNFREVKTLLKVIDKLWENIRHGAKKDPLYYLSNQVREYMGKGIIGKYPQDTFTFLKEFEPKVVLENPGKRGVHVEKGKEISLDGTETVECIDS